MSRLEVKRFRFATQYDEGAARSLTSKRWGDEVRLRAVERRQFEETEIIDIKGDDELAVTWDSIIHARHDRVLNDEHASWIAVHPRRWCNAMWMQAMRAQFIAANAIPHFGWNALAAFGQFLLDNEHQSLKQRPVSSICRT